MDTKRSWLLAVGLAGLAVLGSCINDEPPDVARVLVEASAAAAPLTLIVSTNFLVRINEQTNRREAVPLKSDTVHLTGSHDQEFDISALRRIYVLVKNDEPMPQQVRLRVLLDGMEDYNSSDEIVNEKTLEYFFASTSSF